MKAFAALFRVNFLGMLLSTFSLGRSRRRVASGAAALGAMAAIMLLISVSYSFSIAYALALVGALDLVMLSMALLGLFMSIGLTIYTAQGLIFSTKDMDLVFSLPVTSFAIMLARVSALYVEVLLIMELLLLPSGVAYLVFGGAGGVRALLLLALSGIFLSFLPTLAGLLFGGLISLLVSRMRRKNLFTTVFSLLILGGILFFTFSLPASTNEIEAFDYNQLRAMVVSAFAPFGWFLDGLSGQAPGGLLLIWAVCAAVFFAFTWLFSYLYRPLLTRLSSAHLKSNYKLGAMQAGSRYGALFRKEAARFFGTSVYTINSGVGAIMAIVLALVALANRSAIQSFFADLVSIEQAGITLQIMRPALLGTMAFFLLTLCPASVSISLEGKNLWVLKSAPVSTMSIFIAKAGFNFALGAATVLLATPMLGFALSFSIADILFMVFPLLAMAAFVALAGLYINLLFPRLDYVNETVVVKQSASVMLAMLAGFVAAVLAGGVYFLLSLSGLAFPLIALLLTLFLAALDAGVFLLLRGKGTQLFNDL